MEKDDRTCLVRRLRRFIELNEAETHYIASIEEGQALLQADGFADHEVRKALRLHDRKRYDEMSAYCREVMERRALVVQRDWTKAESYIKFKRGIYAS